MQEYQRYKLGEFLACMFPWRLAYAIGAFLAYCQFRFSRTDRMAVMNNLRSVMPEADDQTLLRVTKKVFINFGLYLVEFFRYQMMDKVYIKKHLHVIGRENLDRALADKKGVVLLTAHVGNWELGGMGLGLLGYPMVAIALEHADPRVNDFFASRRKSKGVEVVPLGIAVKKCFRALRKNKCVAVLGDRDFSNSSYRLPFLGKEKNIPRGPATLARATGAHIVPVFLRREGLHDHFIEFLPPLHNVSARSEEDVVREYASLIEARIRQYPSEWLMFREFWKE